MGKQTAVLKNGRPAAGEKRTAADVVNFRLDPETRKALEEIEASLSGVIFRRSVAIRRAIINEAARLRGRAK